jgi:hypothetical protein
MYLYENLKGRHHLEDFGVGGKIILKMVLVINIVRMWPGLSWFGMG